MGVMLAANWPDKTLPDVGGKSSLIDLKLPEHRDNKGEPIMDAERLSEKTLTISSKRELTPKNVGSDAIVQTLT